jgi:hypothetical protein
VRADAAVSALRQPLPNLVTSELPVIRLASCIAST